MQSRHGSTAGAALFVTLALCPAQEEGRQTTADPVARIGRLVDEARERRDSGDFETMLSKVDDALRVLDRIDERHPGLEDVWYRLGGLVYGADLRRSEQAWRGLSQYIRAHEPDLRARWLPFVHRFLADTLEQRAQDERSEDVRKQLWDETIRLRRDVVARSDSDDATTIENRAHLAQSLILSGRDFAGGLRELDRAVRAAGAPGFDPGVQAYVYKLAGRIAPKAGAGDSPQLLERQRVAKNYYEARKTEEPRKYIESLDEMAINAGRLGRLELSRRLLLDAIAQAEELFGGRVPPDLAIAPRLNYADNLSRTGDLQVARNTLEVCAQLCREFQAPRRLHAKVLAELGHALLVLERLDEAAETLERALEFSPAGDPDPDVVNVRVNILENLSMTHVLRGDPQRALEILADALEDRPQRIVEVEVLGCRAFALHCLGRLDEAASIWREAIPDLLVLSQDFQRVHYASMQALTLRALGDLEALASCLDRIMGAGVQAQARCETLPGRQAFRLAQVADRAAYTVLSHAPVLDPRMPERARALEAEAFCLLESLRRVDLRATARINRLFADPEFVEQRRRSAVARFELSREIAVSDVDTERLLARVRSQEREILDTLLATVERRTHRTASPIRIDTLAAQLGPDAAAVCYRVVPVLRPHAESPQRPTVEERLEAHVVRSGPDGPMFHRLDLGPAEAIRALARRWRSAILEGAARGGIGGGAQRKTGEVARALDEQLVGKVRSVLQDEQTLVVCLDDVLHDVPFEMLDGAAAYDIRFATSLADLFHGTRTLKERRLLGVGGVDYDQRPERAADSSVSSGTPNGALRGGGHGYANVWEFDFGPLEASLDEARQTARTFRKFAGEERDEILSGREATPAAVISALERATHVHLATHGFELEPDGVQTNSPLADTVREIAPMTLCGLCLSGANVPDADGTYVGVLTGEQIATLDLSGCELVVLSACDTYRGSTNRRGHGYASMQAAFHAAGARCVVSTRWEVPDRATEELMKRFYLELWTRGHSPREALRRAQRHLEDGDYPAPFYWAAFVVTGDVE